VTGLLMTRRYLLGAGAVGGLALLSRPSLARTMVDLGLPGAPAEREIITDYPTKAAMVLQRTRGPLLALRRLRQGRVHPERSVLRALALGLHPEQRGRGQLRAEDPRPCEPAPDAVAERAGEGFPPRQARAASSTYQ
jgi:hypothetical protein